MLELAIIADDLTGAADAGVQFCQAFGEIILMSCDRLRLDAFDREVQALALYTNSRQMALESAKRRIHETAHDLKLCGTKRIYKKIDSCLRGHLGAEVDAVMDTFGFDISYIAPAFPAMGRTTLHDVHRVDQVPIGETEISQDPVSPVRESRLSRLIAAQSPRRVVHMDLDLLEGEEKLLTDAITSWNCEGSCHVVFDAVSQNHLDRIVRLALGSPKRVLLVGSAGLARSLGAHYYNQYGRDGTQELSGGFRCGNHLLACGTASDLTHLQILALLKRYSYQMISLNPSFLTNPSPTGGWVSKINKAQRLLAETHLIIGINSPSPRKGLSFRDLKPWAPGQIIQGFGLFVASVLRKILPSRFFLSGGDTANSVMEAIGAQGIRLSGEIIPGIAEGRVMGRSMEGLLMAMKSGGFGDVNTLCILHEYWKEQNKEGL